MVIPSRSAFGSAALLLVLLLSACRAATPEGSPARPARAPVSILPPEREATFDEAAKRFYAELSAGDRPAAAATLRSLERLDAPACSGGAWLADPPGDSRTVAGARAIVTFDAQGRAVHVRTFAGCLAHAEPSLLVEARERRTVIDLGRSSFTARAGFTDPVLVSRGWVLAADDDGWLAVSRPREVSRRIPSRARDGEGPPRGVAVAGRFLAFEGPASKLHVQRDDHDGGVPARGCDGALLGAASVTDEEVILHTSDAAVSSPAGTQLCWVRRDGVVRARVALGVATCGLARAVPCAWQLQASTATLLGFGGMRGSLKVVDARTGADLPWTLPEGYRTEGGSPSHFAACGERLCASVVDDEGRPSVVAETRSSHALAFTPLPEAPRRYCDVHGLPVPRELCPEDAQPP